MVTYKTHWDDYSSSKPNRQYWLWEGKKVQSCSFDSKNGTSNFSSNYILKTINEFKTWGKVNSLLSSMKIFISSKVAEYYQYALKHTSLLPQANLLKEWNSTIKPQRFSDILDSLQFEGMPSDKVCLLEELIQNYFNYFKLIKSELNEDAVYDGIFNIVTQIPAELQYYLELKDPEKATTFEKVRPCGPNNYNVDLKPMSEYPTIAA